MLYTVYVLLIMDYRGRRMKIVGTGLVCLDIVYQNKDFALMLGGTCANVLTVLSQL